MNYKAFLLIPSVFLLLSFNEIAGQTPQEVCGLIKRELQGPVGLPGPPGPEGSCNYTNEKLKLLHQQVQMLTGKLFVSKLLLR